MFKVGILTAVLLSRLTSYSQYGCEQFTAKQREFADITSEFTKISNPSIVKLQKYKSDYLAYKDYFSEGAKYWDYYNGTTYYATAFQTATTYLAAMYYQNNYGEIITESLDAYKLFSSGINFGLDGKAECRISGVQSLRLEKSDFRKVGSVFYSVATIAAFQKGDKALGNWFFLKGVDKTFIDWSATVNNASEYIVRDRYERKIFDDTAFHAVYYFLRSEKNRDLMGRMRDLNGSAPAMAIDIVTDPRYARYAFPPIDDYRYINHASRDLLSLAIDMSRDSSYPQHDIDRVLKAGLIVYNVDQKNKGMDLSDISGSLDGSLKVDKIIADGDTELLSLISDFIKKYFVSPYDSSAWYFAYKGYRAAGRMKDAKNIYKRIPKSEKARYPELN